MHANAALLNKLFTALGKHDHATMASCYHRHARFRDIAFNLRKRKRIHDMWRMICNGDLEVEVLAVEADDHAGRARLVDRYTFGAPKHPRPVVNAIESRFVFEDGLILRQDDDCDAKEWARQALGEGIGGFLAGRSRLMRSLVANAKLTKFVRTNPK
jgi:hypothetical protein